MANNIKVFDEDEDNVYSDDAYAETEEVKSGYKLNTVISSQLMNTILHQTTLVCSAIIEFFNPSIDVGVNTKLDDLVSAVGTSFTSLVDKASSGALSIKNDATNGDSITFTGGNGKQSSVTVTNAKHAVDADSADALSGGTSGQILESNGIKGVWTTKSSATVGKSTSSTVSFYNYVPGFEGDEAYICLVTSSAVTVGNIGIVSSLNVNGIIIPIEDLGSSARCLFIGKAPLSWSSVTATVYVLTKNTDSFIIK